MTTDAPSQGQTSGRPETADDIVRQVDVKPAGDGVWSPPLFLNPHRNVVEGGQLLAQACVAASRMVPGKRVTTAHAIFSRPARYDLPLAVQVTELRAGRQFSTIGVDIVQSAKLHTSVMLLMDAGGTSLYHHQPEMPDVAGPEFFPLQAMSVPGREVRFVGDTYQSQRTVPGKPRHLAWIRYDRLPDDQVLHNALIAQPANLLTINASMRPHGVIEAEAHHAFSTGVLDLAFQFHEDADLTDWVLYDNIAFYAGRGLVCGQGNVFSRQGKLLASYKVQAMVREFDEAQRERDPSRAM